MSRYESLESNGDVSLKELFDGERDAVGALLRYLARNISTVANLSTIRNDMAGVVGRL